MSYPTQKTNNVVDSLREFIGMSPAEINKTPVRLFNDNQEKIFVAQSGLIADAGLPTAPNHYTVFSSVKDKYNLQDNQDTLSVPLTWTDNHGFSLTKIYTFKRGSYEIKLDQVVKNNTGKIWTGRQYSQLLKVKVIC